MKNSRFVFLCLLFTSLSYSINYDCYIQDVTTWGRWDAKISSVDIKTEVCGMFAYSEMTIEFTDMLSEGESDSLELTCNFHLPPKSVVDSLYLWINGEPVSAYLLEKWRAWQIYESIVNRRRDPAFLMAYGDRYYLRIFPFRSRETRKVKINFSSPLVPVGNLLSLRIPADIFNNSIEAPSTIKWQVSCDSDYSQTDITMMAQEGMSVEKKNAEGKTLLTGTMENAYPGSALSCTFRNMSLQENGYLVSLGKDADGGTYFSALLQASKMLNIQEVGKKKVIFVWNGVESRMNSTLVQEGDCDRNTTEDCHNYYTYKMEHRYNRSQGYNLVDLQPLSEFISSNLFEGDSFNVYINDGEIKSYSSNGLVHASGASCTDAASFVLNAPSRTEKTDGCKSSIDLIKHVFGQEEFSDSVTLVFIDPTYWYSYYAADTSYFWEYSNGKKRYYHIKIENGIDVDADLEELKEQLPEGATVYALAYPYRYYGNFKMYDVLSRATEGTIIPITDVDYAFRSLSEFIMGKLYPSNLTITGLDDAYVYDVVGHKPSAIPIYKPLFITGKLMGISDQLSVSMKGMFNGENYSFTKDVGNLSICSGNSQRLVWAKGFVDELTAEGTQHARETAAELSFKNHILTDYTALLALEPGMDTLLTDEEREMNDGAATPVKKQRTHSSDGKLAFSVTSGSSGIRITIPNFRQLQQAQLSLKIYDMKGRMVADLTKKMLQAKGELHITSALLAKGTYIVRLHVGDKVLNRQISIVW